MMTTADESLLFCRWALWAAEYRCWLKQINSLETAQNTQPRDSRRRHSKSNRDRKYRRSCQCSKSALPRTCRNINLRKRYEDRYSVHFETIKHKRRTTEPMTGMSVDLSESTVGNQQTWTPALGSEVPESPMQAFGLG
jgi:hypothetical protein